MSVRKSADSRQVIVYDRHSGFVPVGQKFFMRGDYSSIYVPVESTGCDGCDLATSCDIRGWVDIPYCGSSRGGTEKRWCLRKFNFIDPVKFL